MLNFIQTSVVPLPRFIRGIVRGTHVSCFAHRSLDPANKSWERDDEAFIKKLNIALICIPIRIYQYLFSPLLAPCCRFYPGCSQYALLAITQHGVGKGLWLAFRRLLRCHPWSQGGYDPVLPDKETL